MLAAGGTKHHSELLAPFGLDARDPAFWQTGLSLIDRMISELEALEGGAPTLSLPLVTAGWASDDFWATAPRIWIPASLGMTEAGGLKAAGGVIHFV